MWFLWTAYLGSDRRNSHTNGYDPLPHPVGNRETQASDVDRKPEFGRSRKHYVIDFPEGNDSLIRAHQFQGAKQVATCLSRRAASLLRILTLRGK